MRKIKPILLIFFALIIYIYVCSITFLPNNIILFQGESVKLNTLFGVKVNQVNGENITSEYLAMQTSTSTAASVNQISKMCLSLDLFGTIPLKEIDVNIIPKTTVIPIGKSIGLRLYTNGVMVVGMSEIKGSDNKKYKPYENTGIEEGDMIISVNNTKINSIEELIKTVNNSNGQKLDIQYVKDEQDVITTSITPVKTAENEYKLGLWVRDAAEGVGTVTFYEPSTGKFAALGHPITDVDTGEIINISNGELITSEILSITKGENGKPGEIRGKISSGSKIGDIIKNTSFGIFGQASNKTALNLSQSEELEVALRNEIKEGKAYILCELEDGKTEKYEIEIQKIYAGNNYDNKSMLIKVTDQRLVEKTGGIIQGMSGSPIIQGNKFVRSHYTCASL